MKKDVPERMYNKIKGMFRKSDPITSKIAADNFTSTGKKDTHSNIIVDVLIDTESCLTTHEIAAECSLTNEQIHKRMKGLEEGCIIARDNARKCRITGEMMTTWYFIKPVPYVGLKNNLK